MCGRWSLPPSCCTYLQTGTFGFLCLFCFVFVLSSLVSVLNSILLPPVPLTVIVQTKQFADLSPALRAAARRHLVAPPSGDDSGSGCCCMTGKDHGEENELLRPAHLIAEISAKFQSCLSWKWWKVETKAWVPWIFSFTLSPAQMTSSTTGE